MTSPAVVQQDFWFRNDDGDLSTATYIGSQGSNQTLFGKKEYRIRILIEETNSKEIIDGYLLYYSRNSGSYVPVTTSDTYIQAASSSEGITDNLTTSQDLTYTGTFVSGHYDDDGIAESTVTLDGTFTEYEFCFYITDSNSTNDTIDFRIYDDSGTALTGGYNSTPRATLVIPSSQSGSVTANAWLEGGIAANAVIKAGISPGQFTTWFLGDVPTFVMLPKSGQVGDFERWYIGDTYYDELTGYSKDGGQTVSDSITANAVIYGSVSSSFAADSSIERSFSGSVSADALIVNSVSGSVTSDSVIEKTISDSFAADSLIEVSLSSSISADSTVMRGVSSSISADANIQIKVSESVTASATIKRASADSVSADSVIKVLYAGSITADTSVVVTVDGSITADAFIKSHIESSITADAYIAIPSIEDSVTADSAILRTETGFVSVDSVIERFIIGSINADASIVSSVSGSITVDSTIKSLRQGSISADSTIKVGNTNSFAADSVIAISESGSIGADSIIKALRLGSITADSTVSSSSAGSVTADADIQRVPVWVSPPNYSVIGSTPILVFKSQIFSGTVHFHIQVDKADTFDTVDLREYKTSEDTTNWEYWDGDSWEPFPGAGLSDVYAGSNCRLTITTPLDSGTWYRRVRSG